MLSDMPKVSYLGAFQARYDPKDILGTGASSVVRLCTRKDDKSDFAVKIIDFNSGFDDPETLKVDVLREISILKKVKGHSNIIRLYETFEGDIFMFLVFEVCPYGDLFDYLTKAVSLSEKKTKIIMKQIMSAVDYMHDRSVIHRDLKPENILLDENMNIKVTDFGLAATEDETDELCEIRGTPGYLAPEILKSGYYDDTEPYSFPVDIWACGVIMYTLLFGCPPFWNRKEHLMLRAIMEGKYSFPRTGWNEIKDSTRDIIGKMLTVKPEDRINAKGALKHDFFYEMDNKSNEDSKRNLRGIFRASIISVVFMIHLRNLRENALWISVDTLSSDPYGIRKLRKIIDTMSFDIYSQWVKKGEEQNRAALFENMLKIDPSNEEMLDNKDQEMEQFDSDSDEIEFDEFEDEELLMQ